MAQMSQHRSIIHFETIKYVIAHQAWSRLGKLYPSIWLNMLIYFFFKSHPQLIHREIYSGWHCSQDWKKVVDLSDHMTSVAKVKTYICVCEFVCVCVCVLIWYSFFFLFFSYRWYQCIFHKWFICWSQGFICLVNCLSFRFSCAWRQSYAMTASILMSPAFNKVDGALAF